MENTLNAIKRNGTPKQIHIISVLSSEEGINHIKQVFPKNTHLWKVTIAPYLNDEEYIIPGLGDDGDLSYGSKL